MSVVSPQPIDTLVSNEVADTAVIDNSIPNPVTEMETVEINDLSCNVEDSNQQNTCEVLERPDNFIDSEKLTTSENLQPQETTNDSENSITFEDSQLNTLDDSSEQKPQIGLEDFHESTSMGDSKQEITFGDLGKQNILDDSQQEETIEDMQQPNTPEDTELQNTLEDLPPDTIEYMRQPNTLEDSQSVNTSEVTEQETVLVDSEKPNSLADLQSEDTIEDVQRPNTNEFTEQEMTFVDSEKPNSLVDLQQESTIEDVQQEDTIEDVQQLNTSEVTEEEMTFVDSEKPNSLVDLQQEDTIEDLQEDTIEDVEQPNTVEDSRCSALEDSQQPNTLEGSELQDTIEDIQQTNTLEETEQPKAFIDSEKPNTIEDLQQNSFEDSQLQSTLEDSQQDTLDDLQQRKTHGTLQQQSILGDSQKSNTFEVSDQPNTFLVPEVPMDSNTICYVNQDNSVSFINNPTVFQTVGDTRGELYYACIGPNSDNSQQDQVLQLIPQTQIANFLVSDNPNFVNAPTLLSENSFYTIQTPSFQFSKFSAEHLDSNVFKSINCIGKQLCDICSLEFPSKRTYLKHMSIHENDREFKCAFCKLSYNYEVNLLVHVAIIHSNECAVIDEDNQEMNYRCAICSCLFSRKKAHQAHCLIHQVDEDLPCEHCSSTFKCKILLEKHLNEHKLGNQCPDDKLSTNYLKCKLCHQMFNNVGNIKKHYLKFHPKITEQWSDEMIPAKVEEVEPASTQDDQNDGALPNKRRSSKIASQTIKLYAQGKFKLHQMKQENLKSINKRGRPKKAESKSSRTNCCCSICNKIFKTPILLRRHEVTHTGVKEFECPICRKGFTQKSSVKIHMVIHATEKGFVCQYCGKRFTYEHNMNTHVKVIHKDGLHVSADTFHENNMRMIPNDNEIEILEVPPDNEECGKQELRLHITSDDTEITQYLWNESQMDPTVYVPSTQNWDKSQQLTENRGILLSEHVERVDKETGQLQVHEVIKDQVTGFKRFRCKFCFKLYRKSGDLTRHVRTHSLQRPFQCYMCHKTFRLKSVLKNHFKSHWKLKEYTCGHCNKSFNLKQTLKVHEQLHSPKTWRYSCQVCDKRFNTSYHCKYHSKTCRLDTATDDLPIDPAKPVKTFMWNDLMEQPVVPAVPEKKATHPMYKCNHCGKSYKFKKYLNEHLKDHLSSNNTNVCHFCHKSFLTLRSMQQHLRTQHLNRRKFSCSQCPAFFITKASLIRHGLVHSNSKPYACSLCFQRFKAKIYCDRHIANKKCHRKLKSANNQKSGQYQSSAFNNIRRGNNNNNHTHVQPRIAPQPVANQSMENYSTFRLEDLDVQNGQSSNILVSNYVNQFSTFPNSEKYMLVSLDNQTGKVHQTTDINQNGYFTSNLLIEDPSHPTEAAVDSSENMIGLIDGVTANDMGAMFTVQPYAGNMAQLVDRNHHAAGEIDYTQQGENIYYYQAVNEIPAEDPPKGSLADKFPLLKASLFSDEDLSTKVFTDQPNQFLLSAANAAIPSFGNFNHHSKLYHGCANCPQQFKSSDSLVQHVKLKHKVRKEFSCNVCNKAFSAKLSLWAHSKTHIDSRSFGCLACIACNQRFISVPSLSRHVRMQHNDNLNLYRCTHCNKVYKTTRELDSHVKMLMSEYDALAINSSMGDNRGKSANDVILTNIAPKPKTGVDVDLDSVYFSALNSAQIDKIAALDVSNATKLSLKELILAAKERRGMRKTGKRNDPNRSAIDSTLTYPYSCSICHRGFNRSSNLQQHLTVHTKTKPFQCSKCNNRFRHRCSLKTHETTKHNPITKLLQCHLCLKFLRSQVGLRNHMKIHVRSFPFTCDQCPKSMESLDELAKHKEQKHSQQPEDKKEPMVFERKFSTIIVDLDSQPKKENITPVPIKRNPPVAPRKRIASDIPKTPIAMEIPKAETVLQTQKKINTPIASPPKRIRSEAPRKTYTPEIPKVIIPEIPKKLIKCLSCSFIFNTRVKYNSHYCVRLNSMKSEDLNDSNTCCEKTFESKSQLLRHVENMHNQSTVQYNCAQCNVMFAQESLFRNHQKSVHHL